MLPVGAPPKPWGLPVHVAIWVCSASGVAPQWMWWASDTILQMTAHFFYLWLEAFLCSMESSTWIRVCPVCYTHTWSRSSMWAPIWDVLDSKLCVCIHIYIYIAASSLFCSFFLTFSFSSLSLSKASHTSWWVNKVCPSTFSLFQSLVKRALCFFKLSFAW